MTVTKSLKDAGFFINEAKYILQLSQRLEWLGIEWNFFNLSVHIPDRRIDDCVQVLQSVLDRLSMVSARSGNILAKSYPCHLSLVMYVVLCLETVTDPLKIAFHGIAY